MTQAVNDFIASLGRTPASTAAALSLSTAPSRDLSSGTVSLLSGKKGELEQARNVLDSLKSSVRVAQQAIIYWNEQLLSSNARVRDEALAKLMGQTMQLKKVVPQLEKQEHTIMRLEKDVEALSMSVNNWPANAGLVGGYAGPRYGGHGGRFYYPVRRFF